MCGIAGYWQDRPAADAEQLAQTVTRMAATLSHRGPDAGGCWVDPADGIALGHRRLAIVDLSDAGAQPMRSADGRLVLSYNGELYNAPALRRELQQAGQAFSGHCDTEVVLNAFLVWGVEPALRRFNGMFALALWNANEKSLVLARDRVGKKPLYFGRGDGAWLFGSELKALRRHPGFNAEIDRDALALYLSYAWVPGPRSIYNGIEKLPAGHYLRITAGGNTSLHCYWSAFDAASTGEAQPFSGTLSQAADALEALLLEAVEQRMLADVGLGALLSGGIDSSTVTALMQSLSATPVQTFTIGFDDARYDESASARAIAAHLGTHHTEQLVTPQDAMALIPALPAMYDEPFADASQIPTHLVSRLARESVTVALSGDGGDELFAGYGRYRRPTRDLRRWAWLPGPLHHALAGLLEGGARLGWNTLQSRAGRLCARLDKHTDALWVSDELSLFARQRQRIAEGAALVHGAQLTHYDLPHLHAARQLAAPQQGMMLLDFYNYLADDILVKVDRASMATSLEVRSPLLDYRVVELAWSLPLELRSDAAGGKRVLREVLARHLPPALTERPKQGFGVPVGDWLRGPLRDWAEALLDPTRIRDAGLLNASEVSRLWRQHSSHWRDHSDPLWSILMFQAWWEAQC